MNEGLINNILETVCLLFFCSFAGVLMCLYQPIISSQKDIHDQFFIENFKQQQPLPKNNTKKFSPEKNCLREDYSLFGLV